MTARAYTPEEVIAAGTRMRTKGIEPERTSLWSELGRRGQPNSAWAVWTQYRDQQPAVPPLVALPVTEPLSPEMTERLRGHQLSLIAILERAREEAAAPLLCKIEALEEMLSRALREIKQLEELSNEMATEIETREAVIARLSAQPPRPGLILP